MKAMINSILSLKSNYAKQCREILLVRWKGWPDKYDSWIDKKDVKKL